MDSRRTETIAAELAIIMADTLARLTAPELRQVLRNLAPSERRTVRRQSARLVEVLDRM